MTPADRQLIEEITKDYPRFADRRIDYTHARRCFGLECFVLHGSHILLAERSAHVMYPHFWNGISGFIDRLEPLEKMARVELAEEAGILADHIADLAVGERVVLGSPNDDEREFHMFPVRVVLHEKPPLQHNWEAKVLAWVDRGDLANYKLMPNFMTLFERVRE